MKLSTIRVSHIFNTGALHETDPEGEIERLLGEYFDELATKYCAAGPWRTDVENANAGRWVAGYYPTGEWKKVKRINSGFEPAYWISESRETVPPPKAFATINPPEMQE